MGEVTTKGRFAPPTIAQVAETDLVGRVDGVLTQGNYATTADMDLYVDDATGNDTTGDGSVGLPYKTITRAYADVPRDIAHVVHIHIAAGTYTAFPTLIQHNFLTSAAELIFDGTAALTNEVTEYTIDAGAAPVGTYGIYDMPVVGGGLGVDALKQKFIRFTSGAAAGKTAVVLSNTATTPRILLVAAGVLVGDKFKVMTHGAIVNVATAIAVTRTDDRISSVGVTFAGLQIVAAGLHVRGSRANLAGCDCSFSAASYIDSGSYCSMLDSSSNIDDATIFAGSAGLAIVEQTSGAFTIGDAAIAGVAFFSSIKISDAGRAELSIGAVINAADSAIDISKNNGAAYLSYLYLVAKSDKYGVLITACGQAQVLGCHVEVAARAVATYAGVNGVRVGYLTGSAVNVTNALLVGQGSSVTIQNATCTLVGSGGAGAAVQWSSGAAGSAYPAANNVVTDALGAQVAGY